MDARGLRKAPQAEILCGRPWCTMAAHFLFVTDSFGSLYPGQKSYKGVLDDLVWREFGRASHVTFTRLSGGTLSELATAALTSVAGGQYTHAVVAGMGNEAVDNNHKVVRKLPDMVCAMRDLREIAQRLPTLVVYGGAANLWSMAGEEGTRFDAFGEQVRAALATMGILCSAGAAEIRANAPPKASQFHFARGGEMALAKIWLEWARIVVSRGPPFRSGMAVLSRIPASPIVSPATAPCRKRTADGASVQETTPQGSERAMARVRIRANVSIRVKATLKRCHKGIHMLEKSLYAPRKEA